jgi:hypothetical protein
MGYYMAGGELGPNTSRLDSMPMDEDMPRRPRMNKWNGRALSRAIRRTKGFVKMARKAVQYAHTARLKGRRR